MSRKSSRKAALEATVRSPAGIGLMLAIILLIPRVVRMLYPEIWIEDDFYLESAYLVSTGMRPYVDFVHPHLPILEWFTGGYLWLFGASNHRIELLNEAAIYITSLLVFALGARAAGRPAAIASAILYAFSSLVFRYHVYERECFVAPIIVGVAILTLDGVARASLGKAAVVAMWLALACSIKLTAVIPAAVILLWIAFVERRLVRAIEIGVMLTAAIAVLVGFCYWRYGFDFVFQVFFFHFMKGRDVARVIAAFPAEILDILAPLAILGAIQIVSERRFNRPTMIVVALAAAEYIFFGVLSPTAWGHNYLEAIPFIAIVAGLGAIRIIGAIGALIVADRSEKTDWLWLVLSGVLIVACLGWVTPLKNENWLHGSVYGFGYIPRTEVRKLAAAIDRASAPGEPIIAPSFLCFQANRIELIRFPETYGVYREARAEFMREGFSAARRKLGSADFYGLIASTAHIWRPEIHAAIIAHKVPVVISDSPAQLLPIVEVPPAILAANGYQPVFRTAHFIMWAIAPANQSTGPGTEGYTAPEPAIQ